MQKHPAKVQAFDLPLGRALAYCSEATDQRLTAALLLVRDLENMEEYDPYDVFADWLTRMPSLDAGAVKALAAQFAKDGTGDPENPQVFHTPEVVRAGSSDALAVVGKLREVIHEIISRIFAA